MKKIKIIASYNTINAILVYSIGLLVCGYLDNSYPWDTFALSYYGTTVPMRYVFIPTLMLGGYFLTKFILETSQSLNWYLLDLLAFIQFTSIILTAFIPWYDWKYGHNTASHIFLATLPILALMLGIESYKRDKRIAALSLFVAITGTLLAVLQKMQIIEVMDFQAVYLPLLFFWLVAYELWLKSKRAIYRMGK